MAVEYQLKNYWVNVKTWRETGDQVWITLLDAMAMMDYGPAGRAASRFIHSHNKETVNDTS